MRTACRGIYMPCTCHAHAHTNITVCMRECGGQRCVALVSCECASVLCDVMTRESCRQNAREPLTSTTIAASACKRSMTRWSLIVAVCFNVLLRNKPAEKGNNQITNQHRQAPRMCGMDGCGVHPCMLTMRRSPSRHEKRDDTSIQRSGCAILPLAAAASVHVTCFPLPLSLAAAAFTRTRDASDSTAALHCTAHTLVHEHAHHHAYAAFCICSVMHQWSRVSMDTSSVQIRHTQLVRDCTTTAARHGHGHVRTD